MAPRMDRDQQKVEAEKCVTVSLLEKCAHGMRMVQRMPRNHLGLQRARTWRSLRERVIRALGRIGQVPCTPILPTVPGEEQQAALLEQLERAVVQERGKTRREALARWRARVRTREVFAWIRGDYIPPPTAMAMPRDDGTMAHTTDPDRIDELVRSFWRAVATPPPRRPEQDAATEAMLASTEQVAEEDVHPLTADDLWTTLKRMRGCRGPDGWEVREMKAARDLLPQLAQVYEVMETTTVAPTLFTVGDITLIPKVRGTPQMGEYRPITVMPLIYRLYSSARFQSTVADWQDEVVGALPLVGARRAREAKDLVLPLRVAEAQARAAGVPLQGAAYDLAKAYDALPSSQENPTVWRLMERLGLPARLRATLRNAYHAEDAHRGTR